jgi:sugar phosphate isomerase/epimerase
MGQHEIHLGGTARTPGDVRALHELGLEFAEIAIPDPNRFRDVLPEYQAMRKELGLYYLCHGPREGDPNDIRSLERVYLPKLKQIVSTMPELKMDLLTIHLWLDRRFVRDEAVSYKVKVLGELTAWARDQGVVLCLENLSESDKDLFGVMKTAPLLNLTLDLAHAQLLTDQNRSLALMHKFPERIRHIHLHDNRGGDSPDDDLHLPPGEGDIDFNVIFRELNSIGYHGTITLELRPSEIRRSLGNVIDLLHEAGFRTCFN